RGPYVALSGKDSAWSVFSKINDRKIQRVLVIAANSKTGRDPGWDARESPPGIAGVMGLVTTGPMGNYSFETVQLIAEHFRQLNADHESFNACEQLAKEQCPAFQIPFEPGAGWGSRAGARGFERGTAPPPLQRCLEGLATSFLLPRPQVTLLRQVARRLLLTSPEFLAAMSKIAPTWKPEPTPIDPAL